MEPWHRLDRAPPDGARALLQTCCGSPQWVDAMMRRRPFRDRDTLREAARSEWFALPEDEWREAFRHHPQIGDRESLRRRCAQTGHLAEREQAGVTIASDQVLEALAHLNQVYEQKFGYIFIVCATGRTADEMLQLLRQRLPNAPDAEIHIAAAEQARITELRLLRL